MLKQSAAIQARINGVLKKQKLRTHTQVSGDHSRDFPNRYMPLSQGLRRNNDPLKGSNTAVLRELECIWLHPVGSVLVMSKNDTSFCIVLRMFAGAGELIERGTATIRRFSFECLNFSRFGGS
jgi:hypothetical protein